MIIEDYVSLEVAKLLVQKGFNGEYHKHYWGYEIGKEFLTAGYFNPEYDYPAPTVQMAMKYLRANHNIVIVIKPYGNDKGFCADIYVEGNRASISTVCGTFEYVCNWAIKFSLENLVK